MMFKIGQKITVTRDCDYNHFKFIKGDKGIIVGRVEGTDDYLIKLEREDKETIICEEYITD